MVPEGLIFAEDIIALTLANIIAPTPIDRSPLSLPAIGSRIEIKSKTTAAFFSARIEESRFGAPGMITAVYDSGISEVIDFTLGPR
jgi:hypothetical protein